jgi:hypothetical protein
VFDTRANCFWFASALISDDLPTFDRPTNATSTGESGRSLTFVPDWTNVRRSGELMRPISQTGPRTPTTFREFSRIRMRSAPS